MITEEKQLLLKDLSARLPYGVMVKVEGEKYFNETKEPYITSLSLNNYILDYNDVAITPYLRPMSSMTEEEEREVAKLGVCYDGAFHNDVYDVGTSMEEAFTAISWLLERHFDINYLIQKGLALEAPEDMYKIN